MKDRLILNHFKIIKENEMILDGAIELVDKKIAKVHYHFKDVDKTINGKGMVLFPKEIINYDDIKFLKAPLVIDKSNFNLFDSDININLSDFTDEELNFIFRYADYSKLRIKASEFTRLRRLGLDFLDIYRCCILNFKPSLSGFKKGRQFKAYILRNDGRIIMEI